MLERVLVPQPPFDSVIDPELQTWVTGFMACAMMLALIYAVLHWHRSGKPTFLLLFVGGGAMMAFEPMVDTVGACWFPEGNSWIAFRAYGRSLPLWLCLTYFFYFGIGVGVSWQLIRRGLRQYQLWLLFIAGIIGDFVLEAILLHFDTYYYYGWQPLVVLKFPMWWGAVNSLITMVAGAVVYRYEEFLTHGWSQLQIVPIALSISAAGNTVAGWPSWLVINTDLGPATTQLGGILTFVAAVWVMGWVIKYVAIPLGQTVPAADKLLPIAH